MKIYRVEKDGKGPYRNFNLTMYKFSLHCSTYGRPGIYDDTILSENIPTNHSMYHYGFTSKKSLRKWFKAFNNWLIEKDFSISIYDGKPIRGSTQCLFDKDDSKLVCTVLVKDWKW